MTGFNGFSGELIDEAVINGAILSKKRIIRINRKDLLLHK